MPVKLGPMTASLAAFVRRWVEEGGEAEGAGGRSLTGGPTGVTILDANGDVWDVSVWDDVVTRVEDGPEKVAAIATAARNIPELAAWLPARPADAGDCPACYGVGMFDGTIVTCTYCAGLGWTEPPPGSGVR